MNIENAGWQDKLNVLRLMWKNNELSREKLQNILNEAIDLELSKADEQVNCVFITQCENMLLEISENQSESWESHKNQNWKAIKRRIKQQTPSPHRTHLLPAFGLAVIFVVGMIIVEPLLPKGQINTYVTPDEQMYVVQGETNKARLMPAAMAQLTEAEIISKRTKDILEIADFFGFMPPIPQYFPDGWVLEQYEGFISKIDWCFLVVLCNENEEHNITYEINASSTYDGFGIAYQQNEAGVNIQLPNGMDGYLAYNIDDVLVTWIDGLTCYDIAGPISSAEALKMIESIK